MRLLYTFADQNQGMKFSHFLKGQGVENQLEPLTNRDWGSDDYGTTFNRIWIIEEDQYETALNWLNQFEANPSDARFNTPEASLTKIIEPFKDSITEKPEEMIPNVEVIDDRPMKKNRSPLTYYLLLICGLLFLLTSITAPKPLEIPSSLPSTALFASPVYKALIYDYPEAYDIIDQLIATYGIEKLQSPSSLPKEGQLLLQKFYQTPYWKGLYPQLVNKLEGKAVSWDAPLFEKSARVKFGGS
jgi:GlpG protein